MKKGKSGHFSIAKNAYLSERWSNKFISDQVQSLVKTDFFNKPFHLMLWFNSREDKNTSQQGGELPWFGTGMMFLPFEKALKSSILNKYVISKTVKGSIYKAQLFKKL